MDSLWKYQERDKVSIRWADKLGRTLKSDTSAARELNPSSKVLDAFPRPPLFKTVERRSVDMRRRSNDSAQLVGTQDDIQPDDPIFVLRRAVSLRLPGSNTRQHRMSAPLDEIAMQQLQRELSASDGSEAGEKSVSLGQQAAQAQAQQPQQQMSRQEIIAAQRAASRANQAALLTAQANSERGVDILLPDRGRLRSVRSGGDDRIRYSYIQPDGETYDISDIIEEEWSDDSRGRTRDDPVDSWDDDDDAAVKAVAGARLDVEGKPAAKGEDLLGEVLAKPRDIIQKSIDRVLTKINGKLSSSTSSAASQSARVGASESPSSQYSFNETATTRAVSPNSGQNQNTSNSRSSTPITTSRAPSRTQSGRAATAHKTQTSITSVMSDSTAMDRSRTGTPAANNPMVNGTGTAPLALRSQPPPKPTKLKIKDDFGLEQMIAIIELAASREKPPPPSPLSYEDEVLFGPTLSANDLHPRVRDIFEPALQSLEEMDRVSSHVSRYECAELIPLRL